MTKEEIIKNKIKLQEQELIQLIANIYNENLMDAIKFLKMSHRFNLQICKN